MPDSKKVFIESAQVDLLGILTPIGLVVDRVQIFGDGIAFSGDVKDIKVSKPAEIRVEISEKSMTTFLESQSVGGLKDIRVGLSDGRIQISAVKKVVVPLKIQATCSLRIGQNSTIFVDLESADVMGAGAKNLAQSIVERMNPVLNLNDFPIPITLEKIEIINQTVVATGTVSPPIG